METSLTGRIAMVTGGGSGIGRAIAGALARQGASVIVVDVSRERATDAADWINSSLGGSADAKPTDVTDQAATLELVQGVKDDVGEIDILVSCAGVLDGYADLVETEPKLFDAVMGVNARGSFFVCRAVLPMMIERGYGKIITISSVAGLVGNRGGISYTMSKHAVLGLTRYIAANYADNGVRANAICPGVIRTDLRRNSAELLGRAGPDMNRGTGALSDGVIRGLVPLGYAGTPDDVGGLAAFLAGPESDYITGEVFVVDGGLTM